MQVIKQTVEDFMRELKSRKGRHKKDDPEQLLKEALSRQDLRHARLGYFKKGVLGVEVDSSSRLYLLSVRKQTILERLRKKTSAVRDIRFRLGGLE
ncbi:MAG: DciA family protein [Candidatus Omnitrophota bacterium]|jgi:hypothetical protein